MAILAAMALLFGTSLAQAQITVPGDSIIYQLYPNSYPGQVDNAYASDPNSYGGYYIDWDNPAGGTFAGNNWGAINFDVGTINPGITVTGVVTEYQPAPGSKDTAVIGGFGPNTSAGVYSPIYNYGSSSGSTYTVSMGSTTVAQLVADTYVPNATQQSDGISQASPSLVLDGTFTVSNDADLYGVSSIPLQISGSGSLTATDVNLSGAVTISGGIVNGNDAVVIDNNAGSAVFGTSSAPASTTVTVTGRGTYLTGDEIDVGESTNGPATLLLQKGATADAIGVEIADRANSTGNVTVDASTINADDFFDVGLNGTGGLTVQNGGMVSITGGTGSSLVIANYAGSTGTASVSGTGSSLDSTGYILVGGNGESPANGGSATLTIGNGATATSGNTLEVGNSGAGTDAMTVSGGAVVTCSAAGGDASSDFAGIVGSVDFSGSATAAITGTGSEWDVEQSLSIGAGGTDTVTVSDGGELEVDGSTIDLGHYAGASGTLVLNGSDPTLVAPNATAYVGNLGTGVLNMMGGVANVAAADFGVQQGGNGTMALSGADSYLTVSGAMTIGDGGTGNVTVQTGSTLIGKGALSLGNAATGYGTLLVTGAGTAAQFNSAIIGNLGSGTATVSAGADVEVTGTTSIGESTQAGHSGTLTVGGTGTSFNADGALTIGDAGTGVMTANGGAQIIAGSTLTLANQAGSSGTLTVGGQGTDLDVHDDAVIGDAGTAVMTVNTAAQVNAADALTIGAQTGSTGTLTVDAATFDVTSATGEVTIADAGTGMMTVQNTGTFDAASNAVTVAGLAGSTGTLTVTGDGSSLASDQLTIGSGGTGTLNVQQGASLDTSSDATIGELAGAKGTATLMDPDSTWTIGGDLTVGDAGMGNLTLQSGALSVAGNLALGSQTGGTGKMYINGSGSFQLGGDIAIGVSGSGALTVQQGGALTAKSITMGEVLGSSGTLTVTGPASVATVTDELTAGGLGAGTVSVSSGGELVDNAGVTLAADASGSKGTATVAGSTWIVDGDFTAALAGLSTVTVSGGGGLDVGGDAVLADAGGSIASVTVTGAAAHASTLSYAQQLIVGNGGSGQLYIQKGGVVKPGSGGLADAGSVEIGATKGSIGLVSLSGAGSTLEASDISVGGTTAAAGGTGQIVTATSTSVLINNDLTLWKNGLVNVSGGGSVSVGSEQKSTAKAITVTPGGAVSGTGTIKGKLVNDGGTVRVGDDPGTLTVQGDYAQSAGSTLAIEVGLSSTSLLDVTGKATLGGGTLALVPVDGAQVTLGQNYTVLTAGGGITGAFSTVSTGANAYITPEVSYSADGLTIELAPAPLAFSSGRIYVASNFAQNNVLLNALGAPLMGGAAAAGGGPNRGYWLQGIGSFGSANGYDINAQGYVIGKSYAVLPGFVLGGAISNAYTSTSGGGSSVSGNSFGALLYGIYNAGRVTVSASAGVGHAGTNLSRGLPSLDETAKATSNGAYEAVMLQLQYDLHNRLGCSLTPYATMQYLHTGLGSAQESGAGVLDLRYDAISISLAELGAGLRGGYALPVKYGTLTIWGQLGGEGTLGNPHVRNTETLGTFSAGETALVAPVGAFTPAAGVELTGNGPWRFDATWGGQYGSAAGTENFTLQMKYIW